MDFQLTVGAVELHAGPSVRRNLPSILSAQRFRKAMVLSTPEQSHCALELAELLGPAAAAVYTRAVMHTPVEITEDALSHLEESGADCLVAVGGGSTIGLSKALALRTGRAAFAALNVALLAGMATSAAGGYLFGVVVRAESPLPTACATPR
jgi:maleylacetate reductase